MSDQMRETETDLMLRESARGFLAEQCSFECRRGGASRADSWPDMAELGWFGLAIPEARGGLGGSTRQVFAILEEAGRALALEPLLPNLMAAPFILPLMNEPDAEARFIDGRIRLAWVDCDRTGDPIRVQNDTLTGTSGVVLGGAEATHWVVAAGPHLACVSARQPGVTAMPLRLLDSASALRLRFEGARLPSGSVLAVGCDAEALVETIRDRMAAGAVADGFGAAEAGFHLTLEYLKQRQQFGQPLSALQAVQHMMADAFCHLEQLRSLLVRLHHALDGPVPSRQRAVSAAKAFLAGRGTQVIETCIQLSGGIGVTDDYKLGHYYKRVLVWNALFGDADQHLGRLADFIRT